MNRRTFKSILHSILLVGMAPACDTGKGSLGDLPAAGSGTTDASDSPTDEGESAAPITATGSIDVDDALGEVGAPCQPSFVPESRLLEVGSPDCASDMCLYGDTISADPLQTCTESSDCSGFGKGVICNPTTGECELDPAHIAARSMCTDLCEQDSDCVGADGTTCEGGFSCVPISSLGPVCCQRICACNDDVDVISTEELAQACEAGTQPGCCTQDPPGAGCGT